MSISLRDANNNVIGTEKTIDLPIESMIINVEYDSQTKELVITLQSGQTVRVSVADLVSGLVPDSRTVNGHPLTSNVTVTASDVGLGSVVNTGDSATPVSGGTTKFTTGGAYTELAKKVDTTTTVNGHALSGDVTVTASDVGLGNVDNTSDLNKPISTATQTALDGKVDKTTTVNGKALSTDITLNASDVGATAVNVDNEYTSELDLETELIEVVAPPSADGTYILTATITNGVATYTWVSST